MEDFNQQYCQAVPPLGVPKSPEPIMARLMYLEEAVKGLQGAMEQLSKILTDTRNLIGV